MRHFNSTNIPGVNGNALSIGKMSFARLQFADWLKENHPDIFHGAVEFASAQPQARAQNNALQSGLGQVETTEPVTRSFWEKFTEAATTLGTTYLTLKNQRDAMELNLERAKMGLEPIDPGISAPVIRTQVDLDPRLATQLVSNAGSQVMRVTMIIGAVVLVGLMMMKKK